MLPYTDKYKVICGHKAVCPYIEDLRVVHLNAFIGLALCETLHAGFDL